MDRKAAADAAFAAALGTGHGVAHELAFAVFARWQHNGHDVPDALARTYREHPDPRLRTLAGQAHDMWLTMPMVRAAFDAEMAELAAEQRRA